MQLYWLQELVDQGLKVGLMKMVDHLRPLRKFYLRTLNKPQSSVYVSRRMNGGLEYDHLLRG